jgi:hypothetical protein
MDDQAASKFSGRVTSKKNTFGPLQKHIDRTLHFRQMHDQRTILDQVYNPQQQRDQRELRKSP